MVAADFGACVAAAVATALGSFTCALPPTCRGTDANERALYLAVSPSLEIFF
ncbi:hypothetical protein PR003_g16025 [Phytophthora rubi]|uniref:Uncharacterized protein n=1 Tax=Phytophthora rubi TaxID=129364 RepID=A0A6A3KTR9_9STRA|nr:hypothetical protein PR002_g15727 [Phytophthora rubi]KAE9013827.1 hypothetical protein PR001_g15295 [Phytophthora rubi]KAE9327379.1 hypothetical protein PR003_g16025 [Phytophthora rubi]